MSEDTQATPAPADASKTWPETDEERSLLLDWKYEVSCGDTIRGFRDWIAAKAEEENDVSVG